MINSAHFLAGKQRKGNLNEEFTQDKAAPSISQTGRAAYEEVQTDPFDCTDGGGVVWIIGDFVRLDVSNGAAAIT